MSSIFTLPVDLLKGLYFSWNHKGKDYPKPPLYPNAISVQKYQNPDIIKSRIITFRTPDELETVYSFYKKRLTKNDWLLEDWHLVEGRMSLF